MTTTETTYTQNHHAFTTAVVNDIPVVAVPRNDLDGSQHCGIVGIDGNGDELWAHSFSPANCNPFALGDVSSGRFSQQINPEFFVAAEPWVLVFDSLTGTQVFTQDVLSSSSYSAPAVVRTTVTAPRLVVIEFRWHALGAHP